MAVHVLRPGLLTTVQDLGRPGWAHLGVSACGAADSLSLRVANLLLGNAPEAPALEMTFHGGAFRFDAEAVVALAGGDFECSVALGRAVALRAGETLECGPARSGARIYLAIRGGFSVPLVLGSASTHLASGIGGLEGRALRRGDRLAIGAQTDSDPRWGATIAPRRAPEELRILAGPQAGWFRPEVLCGPVWQVSEDSNRMGLRLRGPALEAPEGHMLTEGVSVGAMQVPPNGQPIILFVEHQTTGGYPKPANVISADLPAVGQLRPHEKISFRYVTREEALRFLREQEEWLHSLG